VHFLVHFFDFILDSLIGGFKTFRNLTSASQSFISRGSSRRENQLRNALSHSSFSWSEDSVWRCASGRLWHLRTRYRDLDEQEIQLNGIDGYALTKEQEENLEKNGYMFARKGGKWPARQFNGVQLQMGIDAFAIQLAEGVTRWGVVFAQSLEFVVPDVPSCTIIPLSPHLALVGSLPDGMITEQKLAEINRAAMAGSREYYFARDFSRCPR
jgi:hypothetical protein